MDALELLKNDHDRVKGLFEQVRECEESADKWGLFEKIRSELDVHTHIEETVFYPAFSDFPQFRELLDESFEEHQEVKDLLGEIQDVEEGEEIVDLLDELMDNVEHHIAQEEGEFFPEARRAMDATQLAALGERMIAERSDHREAA